MLLHNTKLKLEQIVKKRNEEGLTLGENRLRNARSFNDLGSMITTNSIYYSNSIVYTNADQKKS